MLGFDVSETAISRWMKRAPKDPQPAKRWLALVLLRRSQLRSASPPRLIKLPPGYF